jgi:hypothetical protein
VRWRDAMCLGILGGQIASVNTDTIISGLISVDNNNMPSSPGDQNQSFC